MKKSFMLLLASLFISTAVYADTQVFARVKGDRVNLRAKSSLTSETVGQLSDSAMLTVKTIEGEWIQVIPPNDIDFWVHKDFIKDSSVLVKKLNARSGPGINYNVVGSFSRNEKVIERGSFGDWVKVAQPSDASLWVSAEFVDIIKPSPPVPPPVAAPKMPAPRAKRHVVNEVEDVNSPLPKTITTDYGMKPAPVKIQAPVPNDLKLVPLAGQGRVVRKEGELKKSKYLIFRAPGTHRLIERDGNRIVTTAYLRGNTKQLNSMVGERLIIQGREYWAEGQDVPVIMVELIEKR